MRVQGHIEGQGAEAHCEGKKETETKFLELRVRKLAFLQLSTGGEG